MMTEDQTKLLRFLEGKQIIQTSEKNLRSKIDSILSSLESLERKKDRIDFEIRKQRKSLARKRLELKKVSKSTRAKPYFVTETEDIIDQQLRSSRLQELSRLDSILLTESDRVLNN